MRCRRRTSTTLPWQVLCLLRNPIRALTWRIHAAAVSEYETASSSALRDVLAKADPIRPYGAQESIVPPSIGNMNWHRSYHIQRKSADRKAEERVSGSLSLSLFSFTQIDGLPRFFLAPRPRSDRDIDAPTSGMARPKHVWGRPPGVGEGDQLRYDSGSVHVTGSSPSKREIPRK